MQDVMEKIKARIAELLQNGSVDRVLAWKKGETFYDHSPAVFSADDSIDDLVYDSFSVANLSKYLIRETEKEGKIAVLLKPCDTYGFNQLLTEHRIHRDRVYVIGIPCRGKIDMNKVKENGVRVPLSLTEEEDVLHFETLNGSKTIDRNAVKYDKCLSCKGKKHMAYDELIEEDGEVNAETTRFDMVEKLEAMSSDERYAFWRNEFSKCIRCYACRNVCPACSCKTCIFDNPVSGVANKANSDASEENMYHIIRAFHVAGRCTDCGECSRVCPQGIPLHLLNRKFILDINRLYGEYQAGEEAMSRSPLIDYRKDDAEPSIVSQRGGEQK